MNITESSDLNVLLRWLLGDQYEGAGGLVAESSAKLAAVRLADRANKALGAGLRGTDVAQRWGTGVRLFSAYSGGEIEGVLEHIAAAAAPLGPCRVGFSVSDEATERLAAASGAVAHVTVYRDKSGTYAIDSVGVVRGDFEFQAQRPSRPATAEEVSQLESRGATLGDECRVVAVDMPAGYPGPAAGRAAQCRAVRHAAASGQESGG